MKTFSFLSIALALVAIPFTTGCFGCEGGPMWVRYTQDVTSVTLDGGTPVRVPLHLAASTVPSPDPLVVEIGMTDCSAGPFEVGVRMLDASGAELTAVDGIRRSIPVEQVTLRCPDIGAQFDVPPEALDCSSGRCVANVQVELTAPASVGPREVEARLVIGDCIDRPRNDGVIDQWGG